MEHFISKQNLKFAHWYSGQGRLFNEAVWDGRVFRGWTIDCGQRVLYSLPHFEDEEEYAAFYPTTELGECEEYIVENGEFFIGKSTCRWDKM